MKNRKNIFIIAIVALILVLGVGYAVVSQTTLTINGNVGAATTQIDVVYDGVNSGTTGKVTAISSPDGSKAATFTMAEMVLDEAVPVEFEIENREADINATINYPTVTNPKSSYFSTALYYKGATDADYTLWESGTKSLAAGAKAKIKVVVTLTSRPVSSDDSSATITVSYTAEPAA